MMSDDLSRNIMIQQDDRGFRAAILYQASRDLSEGWQMALEEQIDMPEDVGQWYEASITWWCKKISEAAVNAGCEEFLTSALEDCQNQIEEMGMMFDSSGESPFI